MTPSGPKGGKENAEYRKRRKLEKKKKAIIYLITSLRKSISDLDKPLLEKDQTKNEPI